MKTLVVYKLDGIRKQRTFDAKDIYEAEREIRKDNSVSEHSKRLVVTKMKHGRTVYEVNGTVLG